MDEIIYQSNNQNSVYVLNSNYRSYGDYEFLKLIDPNDMNNKNMPNYKNSSAARSGSRCCSAGAHIMQHKLHNLGKFCEVTEIIGNAVTSPPSLLAAALSTTSTTPPTSRCLPPAPAFQNFFNCSFAANATGGTSANATHDDGSTGGGVDAIKIKPNNSNKKKCANVKPSLMEKKTKFRKFIEEEKWRTCDTSIGENVHQRSTSNNDRVGCTGSVTPTEFRTNSYMKESNAADSTTLTTSMAAKATCASLNNIVKHYWNDKMDANATGESKRHQHRKQSNNWSGSSDSNNQHRQKLEVLKSSRQQKSNYELYKEASELLGLSCTLCDNCRCLECQSSYFECDDSDSFSELSNSDGFDEDIMGALNNSVDLVMYTNCYRDDVMITYDTVTTQQQSWLGTADQLQHEQLEANFIRVDADSNASEMLGDDQDNNYGDNEVIAFARQTGAIKHKELPSEQRPRSNVLENFTSFNELRLADDSEESFIGSENHKKG
ncbi:uncharacterized protein LOC118742329 isoform X2 [Rhagoletis pomonella]|nr:uncharacterized protein LOC118742329 isoform X2 [Rhagoletis pomonella]